MTSLKLIEERLRNAVARRAAGAVGAYIGSKLRKTVIVHSFNTVRAIATQKSFATVQSFQLPIEALLIPIKFLGS